MHDWNIVLVNGVALQRQGLRTILEAGYGLRVVGEADNRDVLFNLLRELEPHMVILDASLPDLEIETVFEIRTTYPDVRVLILGAPREGEYLYRVLRCGADGYLLKEDTAEELLAAVEKIRRERMYVSPRLSPILAEMWLEAHRRSEESLTSREREVLRLVGDGKSSKAIAGMLSLTISTVKCHRANIMRKLRLKRGIDLVKYAINGGII